MKKERLTRREFVAALAGWVGAMEVANADVKRYLMDQKSPKLDEKSVSALFHRPFRAADANLSLAAKGWRISNTTGEEVLTLSSSAPTFDFGSFQIGGRAGKPADWKKQERNGIIRWIGEWRFASPQPAIVRAILEYHRNTSLIYKCAEIRLKGDRSLLHTVTIDEVNATDVSLVHNQGVQSHPILGRSFFCGVEYPVAPSTQVNGNHIVLGHAPGVWLEPSRVYRSRTAVYGLSPDGKSRQVFEDYIAALRPDPVNIHWNYNSWWTSPVPYNEEDILKIIKEFKDNLYHPYHEMTDTFCIDMGWTKSDSIWQINPALFPNGFTGLEKALKEIHSKLGLWISPSAVYGQALDLAWAQKAGYEADGQKCCLGGARYQAAFKNALSYIVGSFDLGHVKFDGYVEICNDTNHGHQPGLMSAEPIAEGIIDVFQTLREMKHDSIWMEPTCFGFDPSPWWIMYCNSVIGCFGDDSPNGQIPCPNYRESYTTARDYFNLKGDAHIQIPIAAIDDLGIDHQTNDPFQNDAITTVLRGNQFLPLYVNPAYMSPQRWEFLAALMKWARRNADVLSHTKPIYPASWGDTDTIPWVYSRSEFPREPYGYAHWKGERGLLCLRNPWIETATLSITPSKNMETPREWDNLTVELIYPEKRVIAGGVKSESPLAFTLAPYETALYEIRRESRKVRVSPVVWKSPTLALNVKASRLQISAAGSEYGADYTLLLPEGGDHLKVLLNGEIRLPDTGQYELMVLAEDSKPVSIPVFDFKSNGESVDPSCISSATGWRATGNAAMEDWVWLVVPLQAPINDISASIILKGSTSRLSAWVVQHEKAQWNPLKHVDGSIIPSPEDRYYGERNICASLALDDRLPVERGESPMQRISGVYLDTLKPVFATQGWGTLQPNHSVTGSPLQIGGRVFLRGLGTHANSKIVYDLDGKYRQFKVWAGADHATTPTITMEIKVDGRTVWKSALLTRSDAAQRVIADVLGAKQLELLVGDGGDGIDGDHADWADAILVR